MASISESGAWNDAEEQALKAAWTVEPPKLNGTVTLADYSEDWPRLFEREAARIHSVLTERVLLLEHFGSTSVPGLAAKPIIDILLVVPDPADEPAYVPDLERSGYRLVIREPHWHEHRCLKGPDTNINLHVHRPGSPAAERELRFRDRLRSSDEDRQLYEDAKRRLAARTWTYIQQYADAKNAVIADIMTRARPAPETGLSAGTRHHHDSDHGPESPQD